MDYFKLQKSRKNSNNKLLKTNLGSLTNRNFWPKLKRKVSVQENNTMSMNSTGFTFELKKNNSSRNLKSNDNNSNLLYIPKKKYNEEIEEKKIKDTLFKLSNWDIEFLEKKKFQGLEIIQNFNKETKKQIDLIKKKERVDDFIKNKFYKLPKVNSQKLFRNKSQGRNENKFLNFSPFSEDEKENEKEEKIPNVYNDNLMDNFTKKGFNFDILREQKRIEMKHRKELKEARNIFRRRQM